VNICSWDALKMDKITGHIKAQMAIVKQWFSKTPLPKYV
jgi:hypothetical protein